MAGGGVGAVGEEADEGLVVGDGLGLIVAEEVHVAAGVERLLGPAAAREALGEVAEQAVVFGGVVLVAGELGQQVELEGGGVVVGLGQALDVVAA